MNHQRTRFACYYTYLALSSVFVLPPLLFMTFHDMYGISYTLLGTLVLLNFCTQLAVDLIFSFFSKRFRIQSVIRVMPLITTAGLLVYAFAPALFPQNTFAGLAAGTVLFSVAAGLCEVLLSPIVAALPSDNPERDMSRLHSLYAYGILSVIVITTAYLQIFGTRSWMYLTLFFALLPLVSFWLFRTSPIPDIGLAQSAPGDTPKRRGVGLMLFAACIFTGSAAENAMTNWLSGYVESVLRISKAWGDLLGMALFAALLGLARSLYAKYGKHIWRVLLLGMAGAAVCYLAAGLSRSAAVSLIACVCTGLFTSMLWPGTLIMMEERMPHSGVVAYALMAAGGDFGASVSPQLLGIVADQVSSSAWAANMSAALSVTPEQIGLKAGMIVAALFPLAGIAVLLVIRRYFGKGKASAAAQLAQ